MKEKLEQLQKTFPKIKNIIEEIRQFDRMNSMDFDSESEREYLKFLRIIDLIGEDFKKEVYAVEVIESERGWGSKVDDHMLCLTFEDAKLFKEEFNSKNNEDDVPDYYMYANIIDPKVISLKQYLDIMKTKNKRVWNSVFEK